VKIEGLLMFAALAVGQDQTGSVGGVVRDAVSHQPVKKATVTLNLRGGMGAQQQHVGPQSAVTDITGTFSMTNVEPGKYQVMVQQQRYPQSGAVRKTVEVKAGEKAGPFEFELIPPAAVTGHVLDEDGDPMSGCSVEARKATGVNARFSMSFAQVSVEDGAYRLSQMAPGKYILLARCRQPAFQARAFSQGPDAPPSSAYPVQYYPATVNSKSAEAVELVPGSEKAGIEFRMSPAAVTQIHGRFATGGGDLPSQPNLTVQLVQVDEKMASNPDVNVAVDREKGTFEYRQVFPGSYTLTAYTRNPEGRVGATQRVDVKDTPVDVVVSLQAAMNIEGTAEIEGNPTNTNANTSASTASSSRPPRADRVELVPERLLDMPRSGAQIKEDGTFVLTSVLPGLWRLQVNSSNGFLKSAWLGTSEVTNNTIDLSAGAPGPLKLTISTNTGTIRGTGPPGQNVFVQTIDEAMFANFRVASVDQSGQFKLEGLAPGKYRIGSMESDGPMPEEGGQEITVHEGETLMIDVKARSNYFQSAPPRAAPDRAR
jgi:hypothetical protein